MDTTLKLPDDVGKAYKPTPGLVREIFHPAVGRVDLNKISLDKAKILAEKGILLPAEKQIKEIKETKQ